MKPYQIIMKGTEAEVDLYGEVVDTVPTDYLGNVSGGDYIALDAFLDDLDTLKDKSAITFRINSIGGDANAGVAIYNRIRELTGVTTTIVDGLAASAASIIAQAGDHRIMNIGTQMMIHGASGFLYGYYNEDELKRTSAMLGTVNKSIAEIYAKRSGKSTDDILEMMTQERWLTPTEAVDNGLCDEVWGRDAPGDIEPINKIKRPVMAAYTNKGGNDMTLDELKSKHPELVDQIREEAVTTIKEEAIGSVDTAVKDAVQDAVSADRARMKAIDEIADMVGDASLIQKAKYDEPMTAEQLAFVAMKTQAKQAGAFTAARAAEVAPANDIAPTPVDGAETETSEDIIADAKAAAQAFLKGGKA